tara:strand:+ start:155 stop:661 length:507 start_codon:yes stop_codon:yes gene_type:complete
MVEIITGVTLAARVVFFVASYRGYKAESKKEDDRAIRNWIMESINGLRNHAVNLMETGYRNDDDNLEGEAKVMIDNIDLFKNEVNLAATGEVQSIWNKKSSPDFDNLIEFDANVIEEIDKVNKIMAELEIEVNSEGSNKIRLIGEAKSGITVARNHFIQRMQFIKGVN